jgi:hypothetical protein
VPNTRALLLLGFSGEPRLNTGSTGAPAASRSLLPLVANCCYGYRNPDGIGESCLSADDEPGGDVRKNHATSSDEAQRRCGIDFGKDNRKTHFELSPASPSRNSAQDPVTIPVLAEAGG